MIKHSHLGTGILLTLMLLLASCSKENLTNEPGWNALTFTESSNSEYQLYMNEPHINLTFPAKISSGEIFYDKGLFNHYGRYYAITGHNWGSEQISIILYRGGAEIKRVSLTPELSNGANSPVNPELKTFTLNLSLEDGDYQFGAIIIGTDGHERALRTITLHNSENKLTVN